MLFLISPRYARDFAAALLTNVESRFPGCGTENGWNSIAHYLDPYSKGVIVEEFGKIGALKEEIQERFGNLSNSQANPESGDDDVTIGEDVPEEEDDPTESLLRRRRSEDRVQSMPVPCAAEMTR